MSSKTATEQTWSLTRRMSVMFAFTTILIVSMYALWSSYLVFDRIRDATRIFMVHELEELNHNIASTDGSLRSLRRCLKDILEVNDRRDIAFRIRGPMGALLLERGEADLLQRMGDPVTSQDSWRKYFFSRSIVIGALDILRPPARIEIMVDATDGIRAIKKYLWASFFTFLGAAALSGLAGWFTAHRGLKGLRDVISQAKGIESTANIPTIQLNGAPLEVREVGAALDGMLERINRGMRGMRTFTAGLAHELRSPLQNLIGETEVALLSQRSGEEYRELLASNLEDLHDLSAAVDNLVAYCRTNDPDRRELHTEYFDLAAEARLRLEGLRRQAERKNVNIKIRSNGNTGLFADREGCLRIVRNLVGNALNWAPPDSAVDVVIQGGDTGIALSVMDRGPGVPDELKDRIFEPFVSGRLRHGKRAGYGLGLAICRSIIKEHGGSLYFEHREEGGTTFVANLPRGTAHHEQATTTQG